MREFWAAYLLGVAVGFTLAAVLACIWLYRIRAVEVGTAWGKGYHEGLSYASQYFAEKAGEQVSDATKAEAPGQEAF